MPLNFRDRVLIARRPFIPGPPLTGTAVGRYLSSRETVYTVVLDAPTEDGQAIIDCLESQLLILPRIGAASRSQDEPESA